MEVVWSRLARKTLTELLQFVERHFSTKTAQGVANSIIEYTNLLRSFPRIGFEDSQLSTETKEVRLINCKKNSIYYVIIDQTIIIVAIFDTRRNPSIIKNIVQSFLHEQ